MFSWSVDEGDDRLEELESLDQEELGRGMAGPSRHGRANEWVELCALNLKLLKVP